MPDQNDLSKEFKKALNRMRSELYKTQKEIKELKQIKKELQAFPKVISGNYWTQTGMPWSEGEGRKAVMTEYFWNPIRGQPRRVDTNELRQFSQTFWVNSCVKTLMDEISSLDWSIDPKDGYEREWVQEAIDEVTDFLQHPNKNGESFTYLLRALLKDILEIDAGVIVKVYDINSFDFWNIEPKSGAPMLKPFGQRRMTELYIRDGASFLKEIDKFGFEKGAWQYSYQIPAHPMWFNKDEYVYCIEQSRSMSCYGYARTQAILDIIKSLHYSTLYNKRFFEEIALPEGIISLKDANEDQIKQFTDDWDNAFRAQPHKISVVSHEIDWKPITMTQQELQFLETQKSYFTFIISMFGLSPSELGITENINRSTSATQAEVVKRKGIRPFLKLIENYINLGILPEFGYEGIEFQFIYDDPSEKKLRLDNWKSELEMGVKTPNEVRKEMGLKPVSGGDITAAERNQQQLMQMTQKPEEGKLPTDEEERESTGYKDHLRQQEGYNAQRIKETEEERKRETQQPYSDNRRPVGNFKSIKEKSKYKTMPLKELIEEHRKLVQILESGDKQEIKDEAKRQKEELEDYIEEAREKSVEPEVTKPGMGHSDKWWEIYHALRRDGYSKERAAKIANSKEKGVDEKGIDDGQYYRDQPISQPLKPSGAHFQPQNPKPTDTRLPTPFDQLTQPHTDSSPSDLGTTRSQPGKDTWDSDKNRIYCPTCGMATLSYLNTMESIPEEVRCTNCGAKFNTADLLDHQDYSEMENKLMSNPSTKPFSVPTMKPKSFNKQLDLNMSIKDFAGFDVSKSFSEAVNYANSKKYKNLLKDYLQGLSKSKIDKIITIIRNSMKTGETVKNVKKKINSIINDEERSEIIARTEIVRVSNEGNLNHMEDKGIGRVEYLSAPEDGRLCEECAKHNGKIYTVKEAKGMIPRHPSCRCTFLEHD